MIIRPTETRPIARMIALLCGSFARCPLHLQIAFEPKPLPKLARQRLHARACLRDKISHWRGSVSAPGIDPMSAKPRRLGLHKGKFVVILGLSVRRRALHPARGEKAKWSHPE